jgi:hypothetical protein
VPLTCRDSQGSSFEDVITDCDQNRRCPDGSYHGEIHRDDVISDVETTYLPTLGRRQPKNTDIADLLGQERPPLFICLPRHFCVSNIPVDALLCGEEKNKVFKSRWRKLMPIFGRCSHLSLARVRNHSDPS